MANYQYVTATGLIMPDTADILSGVVAEFRSAIAPDLEVGNETPQGALIAMEAEARDAAVRNNADVANQINPDIAEGIFFDAIWRLTGGRRRPATHSTVNQADFTGVPGTFVPTGTQFAVADSGALFMTIAPITLNASGLASGDLWSVGTGPIAAPANSITVIAPGAPLGLESVNNPEAAIVGRLLESTAQARFRRRQTLALQGSGTPGAVQSRLANIEGVRSFKFRENVEDYTQVIDGITLKPHSIWVCVDGGTDAEISTALLGSKGAGSGWNGAIVVPTVEPVSGQTYDVQHDKTEEIILSVRVTARFNNLDGNTIIPAALVSYANGDLEGDPGLTTGTSVFPFELAGAINQAEPRIVVANIELSTNGGTTWTTSPLIVDLQHVARLTADNVVVVPIL